MDSEKLTPNLSLESGGNSQKRLSRGVGGKSRASASLILDSYYMHNAANECPPFAPPLPPPRQSPIKFKTIGLNLPSSERQSKKRTDLFIVRPVRPPQHVPENDLSKEFLDQARKTLTPAERRRRTMSSPDIGNLIKPSDLHPLPKFRVLYATATKTDPLDASQGRQ